MYADKSDRELAEMVRGTVEASVDERQEARSELVERGYSEDTILDLAGPLPLEDIAEGFSP